MVINNFFPTGVLFDMVSESLAAKIEDLILPRLPQLSLDVSNENYNDFHNPERIISLEELSPLVDEVYKCQEYYCKISNFTPGKITGYWVQDYRKNDYHTRHNHGSCSLSVVYWVRNKGGGPLSIYNPNPHISIQHQTEDGPYSNVSINIPPIKGGIVMFPSYLDHMVSPSLEECIRTTIAFNLDNKTYNK
tara:strand:- start:13 stop:585 length:573 start_codon:yes stop_codon:yes gene_type:complete